jgi:hypothetical protein
MSRYILFSYDWPRPPGWAHLTMQVYDWEEATNDEWHLVDAIGPIRFPVDSCEWRIGGFTNLTQLAGHPVLQGFARGAGLR